MKKRYHNLWDYSCDLFLHVPLETIFLNSFISNSFYCSYQLFDIKKKPKPQFFFLSTLSPSLHSFFSIRLDHRFNCNKSYCVTRFSLACVKWSWVMSLSFVNVSRDSGLSHAYVAGSWRTVRSHATLCWSHNAWLVEREKQRRGSCRGNV